jgi:hypothetical protein
MVMVLEVGAGQSVHCTLVRRRGGRPLNTRALRAYRGFDIMLSLVENNRRFKQLRQFQRGVPEWHDAKKKKLTS